MRRVLFGSLVMVASVFSACGSSSGDPCGGVCGDGMICDQATGHCVGTTLGAGGGSAQGDGLPCEVTNLLQARCTSCHGTTLSGGAPFAIVTRADLLAAAPAGGTVAQRSLARMKDTGAPMPPSYETPATADEVAAFEAWLNAGLPAGSCQPGTGGGSGAGGGGGDVTGGGAGGGTATGGGAGGGSASGGGAGGGAGGGSATGGGAGSSGPLCMSCNASADCGGTGNFCLGFSFGNYCGSDCSQGQACPANTRCANIVNSSSQTVGQNCVPLTGLTCADVGTGGGSGGGSGGGGAGGGGGSTSCTTDTWSGWPSSFFNSRCNSCHSHTGEFTSASYVRGRLSSIKSRISSGNMPQGSTLNSTDKTRIMTWLNCGAP